MYKPSEEKKDYHCPRCRSQWTQLEVLDKIDMRGDFLCHRCDAILERDDVSAADMAGHERQSKLMAQLEKLLKLMPQIDSQTIPNNDFETAFSHAVPVIRNEDINPARKTEPLDLGKGPPTAVKGLAQAPAAPLEISLTTTSERTAAEQAAEAKRKAEIAAQNVLPVWHTASTVTGETTALGNKERERLANSATLATLSQDDPDEKKEGTVLNNELAAYYAQMAEEKEKEAREDRDASSGSEADDDDEFEDVGIGAASDAATPSSSMSIAAANNGVVLSKLPSTTNNALLKLESESGSSAPGTNTSTPAAAYGSEGRASPAKRIKLEVDGGEVKAEGVVSDEDDDEDEEAEFEDAM